MDTASRPVRMSWNEIQGGPHGFVNSPNASCTLCMGELYKYVGDISVKMFHNNSPAWWQFDAVWGDGAAAARGLGELCGAPQGEPIGQGRRRSK